MNIGVGKLKLKRKSTPKNDSSSSSISEVPAAGASKQHARGSTSASHSEQSVRFSLQDEIIGSLSASSASSSIDSNTSTNTNNEDSLEIMEEIEVQDDSSSKQEENTTSSLSDSAPLQHVLDLVDRNDAAYSRSSRKDRPIEERKNQLFDIDTGPGETSAVKFDIDEVQLSGDDIAKHFQQFSEKDEVSPKEKAKAQIASKQLLQQTEDVDSFDEILNTTGASQEKNVVPNRRLLSAKAEEKSAKVFDVKELSPLNDDDVLINNSKINLNSLKRVQKQSNVQENSSENSLNTTNDISELAHDTESDRIMSDNFDRSSRSENDFKLKNSTKEAKGDMSSHRSKSFEFVERNQETDPRPSFSSLKVIRPNEDKASDLLERSIEEDNSIEEMIVSNHSIQASAGGNGSTSQFVEEEHSSLGSNDSGNLKEKIFSSSKSFEEVQSQHDLEVPSDKTEDENVSSNKQMEKITDFKEALEDISEESEHTLTNSNHSGSKGNTDDEQYSTTEKGKEIRKILVERVLQKQLSIGSTIYEDNKENIPDSLPTIKNVTDLQSFNSVTSLSMLQALGEEFEKIQQIIDHKDYNEELAVRDIRSDSLKDPQRSGDSISLATNSTEYRPMIGEYETHKELNSKILKQEELIENLVRTLKESLEARDESEKSVSKLTTEVNQLRKQLNDNIEAIKQRPHWMRDQESAGQRLSEISCDLVSETDDALSDFPDQYEERSNRNSRERQLDLNLDIDYTEQNPLHIPSPISKQLEQFRKYLSTDELRLFNMVQNKFDNYLKLEMERQRLELETHHDQEMTDQRTYFERKCTELEKQFSEEVISQNSRRLSNETASDTSDQEEFPEENGGYQAKTNKSPKRNLKELIYLSPTHRKITPTTIDTTEGSADEVMEITTEVEQVLKLEQTSHEFCENRIAELNRKHEADLEQLREKLKHYEDRETTDEFDPNNETPLTRKDASHLISQTVAPPVALAASCLQQSGVLLTAESTIDSTNTATDVVDVGTEPSDDLHEIIASYERRLKEQVALARQDVLRELEVQIQALLSDAATEDSHWPPELILLREKFTAKSQLEIAQLQIKHEEEMARMKAEFEKQLQWKLKRQSTFDSARDLDKIISERDNLRELSASLRSAFGAFLKYVSGCEEDLNSTVIDELHKLGIIPGLVEDTFDTSILDINASNISACSAKKFVKFAPDVSGLKSLIEDPSLIEYISKDNGAGEDPNQSLNLDECLDTLRSHATHIMALWEKLPKKLEMKDEDADKISIKSDSCEEEDGLKRGTSKKENASARSFDESLVRTSKATDSQLTAVSSLPADLGALQTNGELNIKLHELKNRLLKSEDEKRILESKHNSLVIELNETKQHLMELSSQRVEFSEGYGTNALLPTAQRTSNSFVELQERAKHLLGSTSPDNTLDNSGILLQLVEDFCREGERYMEDEKRDKMDLQAQIEAADKQLKATRQFLEEQAAEREQERDEFVKEIERLKSQMRDKDKDKVIFERVTKELETTEQHVKDLTAQLGEKDDKIRKLENDLKDSIDKGFTLREIITELETQVESKSINEHVLQSKVKELELYIDTQNRQNESLHQEADGMTRGHSEKIAKLEEELRQSRPSVEQSLVLEALTVQLRDIEETLEKKTKNLETLHSNSAASLVCSSPSEDISMNQDSPLHRKRLREGETAGQPLSLPVDEVQRVFDKLHRHTRIEEVAIKRINDLEMQIASVRASYAELTHERDVLQERMSEQSLKITTLQSKLDEQRLRAEELHRQGTSHLTVKVHDLQNELVNVKETLQSRDKQIANLKNFLENSQQVIERHEKELAMNQAKNDRSQYELSLETELQAKCDEIQLLKNKIKNEMVNKAGLSDLMETMLEEKNDEIDKLKEELIQLKSQQGHRSQASGAAPCIHKEEDNARTLSDIVSITDCDESDMVMRRAPEQSATFFPAHSIPMETSKTVFNSKETTPASTTVTQQQSAPTTAGSDQQEPPPLAAPLPRPAFFQVPSFGAGSPFLFQDLSGGFARPTASGSSAGTPEFFPRHINFSLVGESRSTVGSANDRFREPAFIEEINEDDEAVEEQKVTEATTEKESSLVVNELESLKLSLDRITKEKNDTIEKMQNQVTEKADQIADLQVELAARNKLYEDLLQEKKELKDELEAIKTNLRELDSIAESLKLKDSELKDAVETIASKEAEIMELKTVYAKLREELEQQTKESSLLKTEQQKNHLILDTLNQQIESLNKTIGHKNELMSKLEKDILNYSKNEEKYVEQLRSLEAKETELKILQGNYKDRLHDIEILNEDNRFLNEDINRLKNEIARSSSNAASNPSYVQFLKQNCEKFEEELQETKVLLTEKMLSLERVRIDLNSCQQDAEDLKTQLKEKEMIIQQIGDDGNSLHEALSKIQNKMQENNSSLSLKLREEQSRNATLQGEIDRLKVQLQRSDNSSSPKPFSVEEIAEQLEKELNYSAQLDSSLMKVMESDEVASDEESLGEARKSKREQRAAQEVQDLQRQLQMQVDKCVKLQEMLDSEKHNSSDIQMQDAEIIEAMRLRLEAAIDNESELQKLLAEEKSKTERLSTLMAGVQRTKSFDNYLLMKGKSPHESPSRRLNRSNEFESEMVARFESEIKFLTAQNERERERAADLQRVLEREKSRFEKEISDRNEHGEQVKKELLRVTKEKERLEVELDHEQEKLMLAHKEIESLEKRIGAFQEAESMRSFRRDRTSGQNSLEFQDMRQRLDNLEQERSQLRDTVQSLRSEVERRKQREAKLTEALSRENSLLEGGNASVPEEFLNKLRDMNRLLEANARENHQQAETLRLLMEERKALQLRNQELERYGVRGNSNHYNRDDLEERANHLFGKYLRSESHRKALVHQKRYLQIVLTTYEENETKALQLLNAQNMHVQGLSLPGLSKSDTADNYHRSKRRSFRAIVTAVIAIERMKFIVRKWQGGRRVCAKAIFSQQFTPRRSQSATTNVWARSPNSHFVEYNASPPSRDRPPVLLQQPLQHETVYSGHYLRLPDTQLLMNADLRERLEDQYNRTNNNR
ncbi:A-kinase anchor protein 9 isoform X2 [Sabethes cyaneus]|uniref:A-kinase anchor protein 9 isoform X2 n=1 Tax=Sabethes cyaneus TaxID=53552 RepID=UPI00237E7278|nr:A-kinase anchor protein 9 isoform X2 [Sabethes cyaneus]